MTPGAPIARGVSGGVPGDSHDGFGRLVLVRKYYVDTDKAFPKTIRA